MRKQLGDLLPADDSKRKWVAISTTVLIAGILTGWGIYGIGQYGIALFIFTPIFIGGGSTILYGLKKKVTQQEAWHIGLLTLSVFLVVLVAFAIEGIICIMMAAPFGLFLTWVGSLIGYSIVNRHLNKGSTTFLLMIGIIPAVGTLEKGDQPKLLSVVSSIQIDAPPQTVWKNVIQFPQLEEPTEFLFKTGIAYPINARISGTGVGAVRHCNFTTGSFIEPITVWNEPQLLRFTVAEQPEPMKEISFWDVDAPHLHDYFVSKQGQFRLIRLSNGKTLLEGTTWYYHNIRPVFYWQLWSDYIVHKIHMRVLTHIKKNSEMNRKRSIVR